MATTTLNASGSFPLAGVILPFSFVATTKGASGGPYTPPVSEVIPVGGASVWDAVLTGFAGTYGKGGTGGYSGNADTPTNGTRAVMVFRWTGDLGGLKIEGPVFGDPQVTGTFNTTAKLNLKMYTCGNGANGLAGKGGASSHFVAFDVPSNIGVLDYVLEFIDQESGDDSTQLEQPGAGVCGAYQGSSSGDAWGTLAEGSDDDDAWRNASDSELGNSGTEVTEAIAAIYGYGGGSGQRILATVSSIPPGATSVEVEIGSDLRAFFNTETNADGIIASNASAQDGATNSGNEDGHTWITGGTEGVNGDDATGSNGGDGGDAPSGGAGGVGGTASEAATNGTAPGGGGGGQGATGSSGTASAARVVFTYSTEVVPPTITNNGGGAKAFVSIEEDTTDVTAIAYDGDNSSITLSGSDAAKFELFDEVNLRFVNAPNFEVPSSALGMNVYIVDVNVTNAGGSDTQRIYVTVTNNTGDDPAANTNTCPIVHHPIFTQTDPADFIYNLQRESIL